MAYLDMIARLIRSKPAEISGAKKQTRERIAKVLTGLHVLSQPPLRKAIEMDDATYRKVLAQLTSNKAAAHHVITAGDRLPSMQSTMLDKLNKLDKLSPSEQQSFITQLQTIYSRLK